MPRLLPFLLGCSGLLLSACASAEPRAPRVLATLTDGQVLVGELDTRTFTLTTGLGTLAFDTRDAGELGPLEGADMEQAGAAVRLWLRDGSEFVGKWEKPSVSVAVSAGGARISVDVPIRRLKRLQFQGEAVWPDGPVFRVVTGTGDDFFVDVTKTRIAFANDLGRFEPFLEEIQHVEPADPGRKSWHVWFDTGTRLVAGAAQKTLDLKLALGPDSVTVGVGSIVYMDRQTLDRNASRAYQRSDRHFLNYDEEAGGAAQGFYSNEAQKESKANAGSTWPQKQGKQGP
ncbi:MAG: hypothetical protein MUC63_08245 [Planctomycetes bacterium]|nr:hypothetical protein [Planctomycetota bacterium]